MKRDHQNLGRTIEGNVNFKKGYTFTFNHKGHEIVAFGSAKSGKEILTIDGKKCLEKRCFRRRSVHNFVLDSVTYEIEFYMANQFAGELHCSLIEDGTHVSTQKKALKKRYQINGRHKFLILLGIFIAGGGLGFVTMNVLLALFGG